MKLNFFFLAFLVLTKCISAQTVSANVDQIITAEKKFVELVKQKSIRKAFLSVSDDSTIVFRPGPVKVQDFYKDKQDEPRDLWWEPMYARISKSGDWGFTSGPYILSSKSNGLATGYGDYFSVWKKGKSGWKLAIDIGIPHKKPVKKPELMLDNPLNEEFVRTRGEARLQQREDIVFSNDKLFGTILKADNAIAHKEFLAENTRLLFPGYEAIVGKAAVIKFWAGQNSKLTSQPIKADRALSGELAYTYGNASILSNGLTKKYYYLRLWELLPGFKWGLIAEVLTPAEN